MKHGAILTYTQGEKKVRFAPNSDFWITSPPNLSGQQVNISETQAGGQIGVTINAQNIGAKDITFDGLIVGDVGKNRDIMLDAIAPMRLARLTYIYKGLEYYLDGYPKKTPIIRGGISAQDFQFVFHAPFPYWQPTQNANAQIRGLINLFQFPFTLDGEIFISNFSEEAYVEIIYGGNTDVGMAIDIYASAPVVSPEIYSVYKRQFIRFTSLSLAGGDMISINTNYGKRNITITRENGDVENGLRYADIDSTLSLSLSPGINILHSVAEEGIGNMRVTLAYPKGGVRSGV